MPRWRKYMDDLCVFFWCEKQQVYDVYGILEQSIKSLTGGGVISNCASQALLFVISMIANVKDVTNHFAYYCQSQMRKPQKHHSWVKMGQNVWDIAILLWIIKIWMKLKSWDGLWSDTSSHTLKHLNMWKVGGDSWLFNEQLQQKP